MKVDEAEEKFGGSDLESWPVADEDGLIGMVRVSDIAAATVGDQRPVTIATILKRARSADGDDRMDRAHVHADQPLGLALARMGDTGHNVLPVVSRGNPRIMLGVVALPDLLRAYGVARADELTSEPLASEPLASGAPGL
jgi:CBS domain-containing protein